MSPTPESNTLETDRLTLRRQQVSDAAVFRQLWTERDARVPPHRQIDPEGRPTEEDIATQIREQHEASRLGLLAVERKGRPMSSGTAGWSSTGTGHRMSPSWPSSCCARFTTSVMRPRQAWP
jgi:ribosomal-protein-alanine N-acetyltransferase